MKPSKLFIKKIKKYVSKNKIEKNDFPVTNWQGDSSRLKLNENMLQKTWYNEKKIVRKHDAVMKKVAKILFILLSFDPDFGLIQGYHIANQLSWARESLECKREAWPIKFQQNGFLATVKTLYSSLSLKSDIDSL